MRISAIIITKNEERNIERCLVSLQDVVDEIIVMDSFSTDQTEAICNRYNVRFFQREWTGYADQKNSAAALATYNIILSVDADEALSDQLRQSILHLKQTEKEHFVGRLNRLNNYCGQWIRHGGWYPDRKIRIFDRTKAQWTGDVHETIGYSSSDEVITLEGDLFHYSYYSIEEHILKTNTFSTIAAMEAFKKKEKVSLFKICIRTSWKMIRDYVCRFGFLDGYYGYVICRINTFCTFLKYIKLYELNKKNQSN